MAEFKSGKLWCFEIVLGLLGALVLMLIIAPLVSLVISTPAGELVDTAGDSEVIIAGVLSS